LDGLSSAEQEVVQEFSRALPHRATMA